jgi:hypothetical protein
MTSFEWALYLAKLIDSHTKLDEIEKRDRISEES